MGDDKCGASDMYRELTGILSETLPKFSFAIKSKEMSERQAQHFQRKTTGHQW